MVTGLAFASVMLVLWATGVHAGPGLKAGTDASATPSGGTFFANSPAGTWSYMNATGAVDPFALGSSNSGTALRKFVDRLPGLGFAGCTVSATPGTGTCHENALGQYIPVAQADTTKFPGSDYYEIGLKDYRAKMHSDLPNPTDGLGTGTKLRGYYQKNGLDHGSQYLGPLILAKRYDPTKPAGAAGNGKPVRIKFFNEVGVGAAGNLFIPVDTTYMGAGMGPDGPGAGMYSQNRAVIHLHGGYTPWISDGTPHQWVTPVGDSQHYAKGMSFQNVPDMVNGSGTTCAATNPADCFTSTATDGIATLFYTNQQSNRLMFYHDHTYGMTRLNVYAGEAAGYLLVDQQEETLINSGKLPNVCSNSDPTAVCEYRYGIPLIIQDKTFVPQDVAVQDAKWTDAAWGQYGDLWFPHVYETNQWPTNPDLSGANNFGRWDYGPWFWPVFPVAIPGLPTMNVSGVPEGFMDTMVVNGTAYPYLEVEPKAYRFRILNASNDRNINLQLYQADLTGFIPPAPNAYPTEIKMVDAIPRPNCSGTVTTNCVCTPPFTPVGCFPSTWPTDGRIGGVPDPAGAGPEMVQIGSEGGLIPAPVALPNQPVNYDYNRRSIVVLNVLEKTLFMGPAERADVIIDFSQFANKTVILYNDGPAPVPAFDPRFDYYTGDPDNTWMGGAPSTAPGYGPNTRTVMQFRVAATTTAPAFTVDSAALTAAYVATQDAPLVPQTTYPAPWTAASDTYARIQDTSLTYTPVGSTVPTTVTMKSKAIQELFEPNYGRMNATLGTELPFTNALIQTTIPLGYIDPATETVPAGKTQIWKITHNGVDTHSIHFHLVNVQVINRVGWDGAIRPPDGNELGWKETIRMHPLEDIIVAARAKAPILPFVVPNSIRPLDVTCPVDSTTCGFTNVDPYTNTPITVANKMTNFGWEYVWHCHLLGHEENDMMRPLVFLQQVGYDFDGNGKADILWHNAATGGTSIWFMNGTTRVSGDNIGALDPAWQVKGVADFNGDGNADILWRNSVTGDVAIWFMNGSTILSTAVVGSALPEWQIKGVGDFNGDGMADILWYNSTTGGVSIWLMSGATRLSGENVGAANIEWQIKGVGDFNGDGMADILWYNSTTGGVSIWLMSGTTRMAGDNVGVADTAWQIKGVGDLNGDGKADILWYNAAIGGVSAWLMNGTTRVSGDNIGIADTAWQVVGLRDLNGDGKADILWYNAAIGGVSAWLMNGTTRVSGDNIGIADTAWQVVGN